MIAEGEAELLSDSEPKSYRELFAITWKLILVTMILGLHKEVDTQILTPYLYTRVECCGSLPGPPWNPAVQRAEESPLRADWDYGDHIVWLNVTAASCNCDLKAQYPTAKICNGSIAPCDVPWLERDDPLWSHSGRCRNYQYVQTEVNDVNNWFSVWQAAGALCLLPTCGKLADLYGRRPVFNWTTAMPCFAFLIFLVDAMIGLSNGAIYLGGIMLTVFLTHGPIGWAMTIDLIPDPVDQARFFPIVSLSQQAIFHTQNMISGIFLRDCVCLQMNAIQGGSISSICGDLLSVLVLMLHLEDYTLLWMVLTSTFCSPFFWVDFRAYLTFNCCERRRCFPGSLARSWFSSACLCRRRCLIRSSGQGARLSRRM
jgi:hypothetical protein